MKTLHNSSLLLLCLVICLTVAGCQSTPATPADSTSGDNPGTTTTAEITDSTKADTTTEATIANDTFTIMVLIDIMASTTRRATTSFVSA
ncbi:MAG: hypothetical protein ACOYIA_01555 [Eubacteriales bacterium]